MLPASFRDTGLHVHRVNGANVVRKLIEKNTRLTRTEGLGWKTHHAAYGGYS